MVPRDGGDWVIGWSTAAAVVGAAAVASYEHAYALVRVNTAATGVDSMPIEPE